MTSRERVSVRLWLRLRTFAPCDERNRNMPWRYVQSGTIVLMKFGVNGNRVLQLGTVASLPMSVVRVSTELTINAQQDGRDFQGPVSVPIHAAGFQ